MAVAVTVAVNGLRTINMSRKIHNYIERKAEVMRGFHDQPGLALVFVDWSSSFVVCSLIFDLFSSRSRDSVMADQLCGIWFLQSVSPEMAEEVGSFYLKKG